MLVLSRKIGQEVMLGTEIRVRVLEVRGNRVRLGFDAPDSVGIQRAELIVSESSALPTEEPRTPLGCADRSGLLSPKA